MEVDPRYVSVFSLLCKAKRPVLVAHPHPDGDTLGAALGMWHALRSVGVAPVVFCLDIPHTQYRFMPGSEQVTNAISVFRDPLADVVCTFDASDPVFAGISAYVSGLRQKFCLLNIDHHHTNARFGVVNVVDMDVSSTAEVVHRILSRNGVPITREIAICLLAGILTDTTLFSNPATTQSSFGVAADLLRSGAKMQDVQRHLVRNIPVHGLRVWGSVLERLKYHAASGVATTVVHSEDWIREKVDEECASGISNFLSRCFLAEVIMVLKEGNNEVRGSLRTVLDRDVAMIASRLGGGGHKKAAGFAVKGRVCEQPTHWVVERDGVQSSQ